MFNGQCGQDLYVYNVLKEKHNGFFLEIGSNDPIIINNTYLFENTYNWKGIMVEYENSCLHLYKKHRPNSIHVIADATKIDYKKLFLDNNVPTDIDYLQIDLEVTNGSTLETLIKIDREILDNYRFATVTFEHDIYVTNYNDTRSRSREIFLNRGYIRVFSDIASGGNPYEDWYVHPQLVDMTYVEKIILLNKDKYISNANYPFKIINCNDIVYS
jgi:hypothetical protein